MGSYKNWVFGSFTFIAAFCVGYLIWYFFRDDTYLRNTEMARANIWLALTVFPGPFIYSLWYRRLMKVPAPLRFTVKKREWLWISITAVVTFCVMLLPGIIFGYFFDALYLMIAMEIMIILASLAAFLQFKPYKP